MGSVKDRRIRSDTQPSTETILELTPRSPSGSSRCLHTTMDKERNVSTPPMETHTSSNSNTEEATNKASGISHAILAQPILIPNDPEDEASRPSNHHEDRQIPSSRLELIGEGRKQSGLTDTSIKYLRKSTRKSTEGAYDNGWRHWQERCLKQEPIANPQQYDPVNVLHFLIDNNQYSNTHLNTLRSSIASVFRVLYPNELPIANQQDFFAAKRRSEVKIPSSHQLVTWDTNKMTQFLKSQWADSMTLSIHNLQLKTIALLCLTTMARPRSDIGRLQARDIHFRYLTEEREKPASVIIHFREPKETQVKTTKLGVIADPQLCPVTTLFLFLQKTQDFRTNLPADHTLFLVYLEKPEKITSIRPTTLSNWIKQIMQLSGIDTVEDILRL
jgi:hypothetical protein